MIDRIVLGDGSRDWNRAWESFVEIYSPAIRGSIGYEFNRVGWQRLDDRMINTVLSDVIVKFLRASGSFRYDPSKGKFRNYLSQIISWCVRDYITASNHNTAEELTEENDKADPTAVRFLPETCCSNFIYPTRRPEVDHERGFWVVGTEYTTVTQELWSSSSIKRLCKPRNARRRGWRTAFWTRL